jgi:hypothetical protein
MIVISILGYLLDILRYLILDVPDNYSKTVAPLPLILSFVHRRINASPGVTASPTTKPTATITNARRFFFIEVMPRIVLY